MGITFDIFSQIELVKSLLVSMQRIDAKGMANCHNQSVNNNVTVD